MSHSNLLSESQTVKHFTLAEFEAIAIKRFGEDRMKWRFVCPACGHVQTAEDYKAAGAPPNAVAYSCVGRWIEGSRDAFGKGPGPCNYAGGGLFRIHRATANSTPVFELAEEGNL